MRLDAAVDELMIFPKKYASQEGPDETGTLISKLRPVHYDMDAADVGGMLRALTRPTCLYIVGVLTASGWGIMVGHQRREPRDQVKRN